MRPSGTAATDNTWAVCLASVTTSLENFRTLIALRTATLTTLHVGAVRAMWCASVRRTKMCCTTSGGRSMSSLAGSIARAELLAATRRHPPGLPAQREIV